MYTIPFLWKRIQDLLCESEKREHFDLSLDLFYCYFRKAFLQNSRAISVAEAQKKIEFPDYSFCGLIMSMSLFTFFWFAHSLLILRYFLYKSFIVPLTNIWMLTLKRKMVHFQLCMTQKCKKMSWKCISKHSCMIELWFARRWLLHVNSGRMQWEIQYIRDNSTVL